MEDNSTKSEEEGVSQKKKPEYNNEEEGDIKSLIDFVLVAIQENLFLKW